VRDIRKWISACVRRWWIGIKCCCGVGSSGRKGGRYGKVNTMRDGWVMVGLIGGICCLEKRG